MLEHLLLHIYLWQINKIQRMLDKQSSMLHKTKVMIWENQSIVSKLLNECEDKDNILVPENIAKELYENDNIIDEEFDKIDKLKARINHQWKIKYWLQKSLDKLRGH
jgi:hypothetical protein